MRFQLSATGDEPYYALPPPFANLRLTPLRPSTDAPQFTRLLNDPLVSPYMTAPFPFLPANAERLMGRLKPPADAAWNEIKDRALQGNEDWLVNACPVRVIREVVNDDEGNEADKFVGDIFFGRSSFYEIENAEERKRLVEENEAKTLGDPTIVWSFGYMLDPAYHSRGITSFLLTHLIQAWAIPHLNAYHIVATAFTDNIGSQRVMLKAGMKYVGTVKSDIDRSAKGREDASLKVYEWKREVQT